MTREVVVQALRFVGVRLTAQQAAKFVPIAGQAVSAALTYSSLRYVCEQHIRQCVAVSKQLLLAAPDERRRKRTALRAAVLVADRDAVHRRVADGRGGRSSSRPAKRRLIRGLCIDRGAEVVPAAARGERKHDLLFAAGADGRGDVGRRLA